MLNLGLKLDLASIISPAGADENTPQPGYVFVYDHLGQRVYDHLGRSVQVPEEFANG